MTYPSQIVDLARPFPARYIKTNPSGGGSYVAHHIINQRLIAVLGSPPDFALVETIRGHVPEVKPNPSGTSKRAKQGAPEIPNAVVGVVCRMTAYLGGGQITVEEAGDCEDPHNWPHDGARLKDAMSDAYKRCAMRLGCGLHLWSQEDYFLHDEISKPSGGGADTKKAAPPSDAPSGEGIVAAAGGQEDTSTPSGASSERPSSSESSPDEPPTGEQWDRATKLIGSKNQVVREAHERFGVKRAEDITRGHLDELILERVR